MHKRIHKIWVNMRQRCNNSNNKDYGSYGGRGIKVCKEWEDVNAFEKWSLENGYNDSLSIDRIDVNKGYSPDNCRWTDEKTQKRNRRTLKNNKTGVNGVSFDKSRKQYEVYIYKDNKRIKLGRYKTLEEAREARKNGELKYWSA